EMISSWGKVESVNVPGILKLATEEQAIAGGVVGYIRSVAGAKDVVEVWHAVEIANDPPGDAALITTRVHIPEVNVGEGLGGRESEVFRLDPLGHFVAVLLVRRAVIVYGARVRQCSQQEQEHRGEGQFIFHRCFLLGTKEYGAKLS